MNQKLALMLQARRAHGELYPCSGRRSIWEGFTQERGRLMFWWNSADGNTHMVWAPAVSPSFPQALVFHS